MLREVPQLTAAYLEDFVIFSQTWKEHVAHLKLVLCLIKEAGLIISPGKCAFARQQVEYLDYVVGQGVVKPRGGKVDTIYSDPVPTTKKKVWSFIRLVGWYSKFIPHLADRTAILTDLTKASAPNKVKCNNDCDRAFNDLKNGIMSESVLHSPDFSQPFTLQTDASGIGLGAVLLQDVRGERSPVLFLRHKLLDLVTRCSTADKERLTMKWVIELLGHYLLGCHFCYIAGCACM